MKPISSAIVVLAGVHGLVNVGVIASLSSLILLVVSLVITAWGLVGWWATLKYDH